jgi:phosphodiester glycosidase
MLLHCYEREAAMSQSRHSLQNSVDPKRGSSWIKWILGGLFGGLILGVALLFLVGVVPAISPSAGAALADFLRSVVGPQPVAKLESFSFRVHDLLNQNLNHQSAPQISWDASVPSTSGVVTRQLATVNNLKIKTDQSQVVDAAPQIGWQAYGPEVNGTPVMARALLSLDPKRPYTGVALVLMDLSKLQLHVMPGNMEPARSAQLTRLIPDLGMVPITDQSTLIASFNGGFKTVNGHFGMMVNGLTLIKPIQGAATIALYKDGHVQIGAWGTDITPSPDMMAYRQNCLPLIAAGKIPDDVSYNNPDQWGYTSNNDITWRTGLGISKDGRYLIYAVGNGSDVKILALALQEAGAYSAMQLDINQYYAHFETYQPSTPSAISGDFKLVAQRLLDKMINERNIYLFPNPRDFFYLTPKS